MTEEYPYRHMAVLTCGVSTLSTIMSLVYNMLLILMCTFYAIKTRKIPGMSGSRRRGGPL